jgi:dienelactone hydrolase
VRPGLIVSGIVGLALLGASAVGLAQSQDGGDVRSSSVNGIPVTLYSSGGAQPTVVVAHGFAGSAQMVDPLARGLMRAGFTVVSFDFPGHGENGATLPADAADRRTSWDALTEPLAEVVDWTIAQPEVDRGRLALLGHSMGAGASVAYAVDDAEGDGILGATVALSLPSADAIPDGEPAVPANLLLLHGSLEPEQFGAAAQQALQAGYPEALPGVTYGDVDDRTARRSDTVPAVEHIGILFSGTTLTSSVDWLSAALDHRPTPTHLSPVLLWAVLALAGAGLLLAPLTRALLGSGARPAWDLEPPPVRGRTVLLLTVIASVVASGGAWLATPLAEQVPVAVGGYLAAWFAVAGAVIATWWAVRRSSTDLWPLVTVRSAVGAVVLTAVASLAVVIPGSLSWSAFSFVGDRAWITVLMLVVFLLFFGADELVLRRASTGRRLGLVIATRLLAVAILLAAIPLLGAPGFLILVLPLLLLFLLVLAGYAAVCARGRNGYLAAVLVQAVPAAVLVATTFPLVG